MKTLIEVDVPEFQEIRAIATAGQGRFTEITSFRILPPSEQGAAVADGWQPIIEDDLAEAEKFVMTSRDGFIPADAGKLRNYVLHMIREVRASRALLTTPAPSQTAVPDALENCRLFAARHRSQEWAATILRFCSEGGATGSPMRAQPVTKVGRLDGVDAAVKLIELKAHEYATDHGYEDLGALAFGNEAKTDYYNNLLELADEIRELAAPSQPNSGGESVAANVIHTIRRWKITGLDILGKGWSGKFSQGHVHGWNACADALADHLATPPKDHAPVCETCNDNGMIGGPSFYNPGEGGEPCPDCEPVAQAAAADPDAGVWDQGDVL